MDKIFLRRLQVEAVVGVFAWEKCVRQKLSLDLEIGADIARAAKNDSLQDTVDYKAVAKRAQEFIGQSRFNLIETLAHRLADVLVEEFGISRLRLHLSKLGAVRGSNAVGVVVERNWSDG